MAIQIVINRAGRPPTEQWKRGLFCTVLQSFRHKSSIYLSEHVCKQSDFREIQVARLAGKQPALQRATQCDILNGWRMDGRWMARRFWHVSTSSRCRAGPGVGTSNMWTLFSVLPGSERLGRGIFWSGGSRRGRSDRGWMCLDRLTRSESNRKRV